MSTPADIPKTPTASSVPSKSPSKASSGVGNVLSLPPKWLHMYAEFVTKNAGQVSQIESTLRSLTYIIPGRFRDAEIASESIHSGVQLLSLYHDTLLRRAVATSKATVPPLAQSSSPHSRYTRFWAAKSALYRRVAYALQILQYTQLLCEMVAKRRSVRTRWRVVALLEGLKALCRLLLLRITRSRPLVTPALPERVDVPQASEEEEEDNGKALAELMGERTEEDELLEDMRGRSTTIAGKKEWTMPRTAMTLPTLPASGDISSYLLSRVLTADDIKPATKLLSQLRGPAAHTAEILHILTPLVYALALATTTLRNQKDGKKRSAWYPWAIGVGMELAARQLRDTGLRTTPLEREEWNRRGWAMGWWAMRGAAYDGLVKGVVNGVKRRVPNIVGGILEDYEYLWENYYFSTSD